MKLTEMALLLITLRVVREVTENFVWLWVIVRLLLTMARCKEIFGAKRMLQLFQIRYRKTMLARG